MTQLKESKQSRARKMMLWFGIASLLMTFAGWTSAYIVSSRREDWLTDFELPQAFWISTTILIISSLTYWMAVRSAKQDAQGKTRGWLYLTLALGLAFVAFQFKGFSAMIASGYYFTGPTSSITLSYVYLIAMVHLLHVAVGLISLGVVIYQQHKGAYGPGNMTGIEMGSTFWHFLDFLWLYLVLFFAFYR
ncbi:cytochrome c oxidase subunit 3 [Robiginitalea myxolifaciens]|uniref:Cytochrome c oxidase subunit 3 n=1 Tax=Robiginitalea myxolifaciens TaxID=400055 RepID=A0A1I6FT84_9FLAO|nr:heme-copper oxidase subunit III [Robiginitalea myxolifaciens]SFR33133.1 cytochrome c oxidase subunit 3 [Robiginitalea myxolifaciens]